MLSIVNGQSQAGETPLPDAPAGPTTPESPAEFEIVLGKRQVAGVLFVATVVVVVFSAVSYLAGKALAPAFSRKEEAVAVERAPSPVPAPVPVATVIPETPVLPAASVVPVQAPLFGNRRRVRSICKWELSRKAWPRSSPKDCGLTVWTRSWRRDRAKRFFAC